MRVPFSWLKEYVAWPGAVEELAELLTMSGTEVEGIELGGRAARPAEPGALRSGQGAHPRRAPQRRQAQRVHG